MNDRGPTNPYRKKARTGPGPKKRRTKKRDEWRCDCEDYECVCHRVGTSPYTGRPYKAVKKFKIDKKKKKAYKKAYKKWAAKRRK
jgi:hypothetical protein